MRNTVNSDLYDETYEQLEKMEKNYKSLLNENEQLKSTINTLTHDNTKMKKVLNTTKKENEQIKQVIKEAIDNERTELGKSVLKQLMGAIQWHKWDLDKTTVTHAYNTTPKVWETTGTVVNYMVQSSYHTAMHVKIMKKREWLNNEWINRMAKRWCKSV